MQCCLGNPESGGSLIGGAAYERRSVDTDRTRQLIADRDMCVREVTRPTALLSRHTIDPDSVAEAAGRSPRPGGEGHIG